MVVAQLAGLGGETQVSDGGDGDVGLVCVKGEAVDPRVLGLVLEVQGEGLVLEVGQAQLGRDRSAAETTGLENISWESHKGSIVSERTEHPASSLALPSCAWS